jgi:hypothetical protein
MAAIFGAVGLGYGHTTLQCSNPCDLRVDLIQAALGADVDAEGEAPAIRMEDLERGVECVQEKPERARLESKGTHGFQGDWPHARDLAAHGEIGEVLQRRNKYGLRLSLGGELIAEAPYGDKQLRLGGVPLEL